MRLTIVARRYGVSPLCFLSKLVSSFPAAAVLLAAAAIFCTSAQASQVTLSWHASTQGDPTGYKVYYKTTATSYQSVDVGKVTSYTLTGLTPDTAYAFAVSAYNAYGESALSSQVNVTTPTAPPPPIASDGTLAVSENQAGTGKLTATDADGNTLTYSIVTAPSLGKVSLTDASNGTFTYTPNANVSGTDSFTFKANDGIADSNTATVTVTITPVNHPPVAQNDTASTMENQSVTLNVLANDSDPDGDSLSVSAITQPTHGTVSLLGGNATYMPATDFSGTDAFTYTISDGHGATASAQATITVVPVATNHAPVASDSSLAVQENSVAQGTLTAQDPDGDSLQYILVSNGSKGTVQLVDASTGTYTYTPNAGASGTDSFTFKVSDGQVDSNIATVTITIGASQVIRLEAEDGTITAPMRSVSDPTASAGNYVWVPPNSGSGGSVTYTFRVDFSGNYMVWGSEKAGGTSQDSFLVSVDHASPTVWNPALGPKDAWVWDPVTDGQQSSPVSFYLDAGEHTLTIQQGQAGTKLDRILITNKRAFIPKTVYEDAEDGTTNGWSVYDASPAGAQVLNVYDQARQSNVIQLAGSGTDNGYRLQSDDFTDWHNSTQTVLDWSMKYSESFVIYVNLETTAGHRYLIYQPLDYNRPPSGNVYIGLGKNITDGKWHRFVRNLQADLETGHPGEKILYVNSILIRGSGEVDDIQLRQGPTLYEDAADGTTNGWSVYDASPAGAQILNVYDQDRQSDVIQLVGSGTDNGYRLSSDDFSDWRNSTQFVLDWSMSFAEPFVVYVDLETTVGHRYLVYQPLDFNRPTSGNVYIGLGSNVVDGKWHRFVRNLQADLETGHPGEKILEVNSLLVRGSGKIDNVLLNY